jgi:hypothetical protein
MIEIVTIWLKIIGIIIAWEVWKYIAWKLINWWVSRQVKQYERGKCPYLNNKK